MIFKHLSAIMLSLAIIVSLAACGNSTETNGAWGVYSLCWAVISTMTIYPKGMQAYQRIHQNRTQPRNRLRA